MDHERSPANFRDPEVRRGHGLVDGFRLAFERRQITFVSHSLGSLMRFLLIWVVVLASCDAGLHLPVFHAGTIVTLLVNVKAPLTGWQSPHRDFEAGAVL